MSLPSLPKSLRALAARLPFGLDETERAGAAFRAWCEEGTGRRIVDLWTYCFVHRYFLAKFAVCPTHPAADLDELIDRAYRKIEQGREGVEQPRRYPHWVSVVCKNTYLNYLRRVRATESLDAEGSPMPVADTPVVGGDLGLARKVVEAAIERLPAYLQPVARMRFLEECSYEEISEKTDTAVPTARSYADRARRHLRKDADVQALLSPPGD